MFQETVATSDEEEEEEVAGDPVYESQVNS